MLPKYIQELAKDQNLTGGGTNGGAQTHSRNGRLLSILPLPWSAMPVPLKLSFWSAPGHSTLKYKFFSLSKVPPDHYVLPPSTEEGAEEQLMVITTEVSALENERREKRCYWRERRIPDPAIYVTFSLILSWWHLWSDWYKCELISQQTALEPRAWISLRIPASSSSPKTFPLWVWHDPDNLASPASCPFLTHSTYPPPKAHAGKPTGS